MRSKQGFIEQATAPEASDFTNDLSLGASASSDGEGGPQPQPQQQQQPQTGAADTDFFDALSSGGAAFDCGSSVGGAGSSSDRRPAFGHAGVLALQQFLQTWAALAPHLPTLPADSGAMANPAVHRPSADPPAPAAAQTQSAESAAATPNYNVMEVDASEGEAPRATAAPAQGTQQE